jgi:Flp pilus assembly protein CpaB
LKKRVPLIIALVIGIAVMGYSYTKIQEQVETATTTVQVLVPKANVEAYSMVTKDNLTVAEVPPSIADEFTAVSPEQVDGRITTAPLYTGKPIDLRTIIAKTEDFQDKQVVGVYIDAARCAGVNDGDIVDVYRISPQFQGEAAPKIAMNCRVLRVTDDKGTPVRGASALLQSASESINISKNPRIVYLLIKPEEVPYVIQGSSEQSYLSLSKKTKETSEAQVIVEEGE